MRNGEQQRDQAVRMLAGCRCSLVAAFRLLRIHQGNPRPVVRPEMQYLDYKQYKTAKTGHFGEISFDLIQFDEVWREGEGGERKTGRGKEEDREEGR